MHLDVGWPVHLSVGSCGGGDPRAVRARITMQCSDDNTNHGMHVSGSGATTAESERQEGPYGGPP